MTPLSQNIVDQISTIEPPSEQGRQRARAHLDTLTKPLGSLGRLEDLAAQIVAIRGERITEPNNKGVYIFAADHGITAEGVSAYPREVTHQMVLNFLTGGAAINVLARLQGMELWIVDAGVDADCEVHPRLIQAKVRRGTRDFTVEAALSELECRAAIDQGRRVVERVVPPDGNTLVLGEMGIGNTAAAALLMHGLTGVPLHECIGRGTGLDDAGLLRKQDILRAACARRAPPQDPIELLTEFGGCEIAMLAGAVLGAAERRHLVIIDGFTVTVAAALAARVAPAVLDYCVFGHCSQEQAHRALLEHLGVKPLLDLDMRLGEGSGAALALSVVRAAVALFNEMATFEGAGVSKKIE